MTYFFTLDGLNVAIAHDKSGHEYEEIGEGGRAYDGDWRDTVRAQIKKYGPFTTPPMSLADAEQLEGLLLGKGYHFDFQSSLYANIKYLGPAAGYAGASISATQYKFGGYSLYETSGSTGPAYTTGFTSDISVGFWQYVSGWKQYWFIYDADTASWSHYIDGALDGSPTTDEVNFRNAMVASGVVTLKGYKASDNTASNVYYADLVIVPYKVTSSLITALYASGTGVEFSDLPYLDLRGDLRKETTGIQVRGADVKVDHTQCYISGTWTTQARVVTFSLRTVGA